jgi:acyl-CoA thioester hydrolase
MDTVGVVHHGVYAIWYEIARMDFFEKAGLPFSQMSRYDVHPVMVNLNQNFLAPIRYPGQVVIRTSVRSFAPRKLELSYELTSAQSGELCSTATSFHIWTGPDFKSYDIEKNHPGIYEMIVKAAT